MRPSQEKEVMQLTHPLKHTRRIQSLVEQGRIEDAAGAHNRRVKSEIVRAKAGQVIELTDLIAAKEAIVEAFENKRTTEEESC